MTNKELRQSIVYLNRYTGDKEQEKVQAEKWLKWAYGSLPGRMTLFLLLKRSFFSRYVGYLKNKKNSAKDIKPFIETYGINMDESLLAADDFPTFNEFFHRKLKPEARPLPEDRNAVVFPADARHMGWQDASRITNVFVKNQCFDLPALLGDSKLAELYAEGTIVLSRLCPVDYHRFHFPVDGIPGDSRYIDGPLASVSPYALRRKLAWLWTNKRELTMIETERLGRVAMLEVGATAVGTIVQTYQPHERVRRGDEKGYFAFGGSTVMTFFEPGKVVLCDDLTQATRQGIELYARQGDIMGTAAAPE